MHNDKCFNNIGAMVMPRQILNVRDNIFINDLSVDPSLFHAISSVAFLHFCSLHAETQIPFFTNIKSR